MTDDELVALGLDDPTYEYDTPEQFHDFMRWMLDHGARIDELAAAVAKGINHVYALRNQLVYLGAASIEGDELAGRVGVSLETLDQWWQLLRLPSLAQPGTRFTDSDVRVAMTVRDLMRTLPEEHGEDALRAFGAGMQEMVHGFQDAWRIGFQADLSDRGETNASYSEMTLAMGEHVRQRWPAFLFGLYWRHQCVAVVDDAVDLADYRTGETELTILFVDLVEFTRLSQRVDFAELTSIIESFERVASGVAAEFGGRLVKLLGDGAMFQFANPSRAIDAGVAFVASHPELPPRRAGLATGRAVSRQGDYFGPVVNLAARLASVAAPGELVVDVEPDGFASVVADPVVLKGYDEPVTPYRVLAHG